MLKVGITGQSGFMGSHLYNSLGLSPDKFERIEFEDSFFNDEKKLIHFVSSCDVLVHLAAMNRHNDPEVIYATNMSLVSKIIDACVVSNSTPHIIFSSSTQEERDNLYGKSKKDGRKLIEKWACEVNAKFTALVIPNVFGPFGNPYYNSVVATFCHQLTHNESPKIEVDSEVNLIYVSELIDHILEKISPTEENTNTNLIERFDVPFTKTIKVSTLLERLQLFKRVYFQNGEIPSLSDPFDRNLFNTFLTYIDHQHFFPFLLELKTDIRGSFVETAKLNSGGQVSFSTTKPAITRGNHYHTRKAERFAVVRGKARIEFRRIGTSIVHSFELDGKHPSFVDMPIWYTHNITNIGNEELLTFFWINEHYVAEDSDTFFEIV